MTNLIYTAHSIVSDKELNVAMYKAFNESIVMVRGAGNGLESMGHFSLFGSKKWRTSKPSGRGQPREVDKKKQEKNSEEVVRPALPDDTKVEASIESTREKKQLDTKGGNDDYNEAICSLQPNNTDGRASTDSTCEKKQLDAREKSDDNKNATRSPQPEDGKKETPEGIDEPTETCDDDETKDEVCAYNTGCTEDKPEESTKKEEQTDPVIEDEPVLQKTPTKAVARKEKARHILPDNREMWYVWATTVSCLLGSLGLFVLGALGYLLSPVLRRFVWLLDNIAVASNNLRFALFPLAKYLLYVAIILIAFILGMTTIRKLFRK